MEAAIEMCQLLSHSIGSNESGCDFHHHAQHTLSCDILRVLFHLSPLTYSWKSVRVDWIGIKFNSKEKQNKVESSTICNGIISMSIDIFMGIPMSS